MMKKILSVFLTAVLIFGCVSVNAAIPQNDGKGTVLTFNNWARNYPSQGTYCAVSTVSDDYFGTVKRYTTTGAYTSTTYKSLLAFDIDDTVSITSGEYVFVSFYYRVNSAVDSTKYSLPTSFNYSTYMNRNGNISNAMDISVTDEWHYMQTVRRVYSEPTSTTQIQFFLSADTSANTDKICIDIADPKAVYMGAVTAGSDATQSDQILSQLSSTGISAISIGETSVDLTANPSSYTTTDALTESDIAVTTSYGNADKVIIDKTESSTGTQFAVKVYPPATDYTSESAVPAQTYTIISEKASAQFKENGGYGTGIINDNIVPMYTGNLGREFNKITTLEGKTIADEPFDKIYNWERTAFTVEGTSNTSYIAFSAPGGKTAKAGDWIYVSFYYRINPDAPDGSSSRLYTSVRSILSENYLGSDATNKTTYININSASWIRAEYIQKLANDTDENWILKLSGPLTKDSEAGTVSGGYLNVDFADIQIIYFGENTGNTDDESVIKETINQKLNTCGLTNVYVNGEEVKSANPSKYETYSPRYSAGVTEKVEITGDTVYGAGTATVVRSKTDESVYYVKSYAPAYDFLNPNASLAESYEVDVKYSYDFYVQDGKLYGVSLEREDMKGVVIAALYSLDGNMTGVVGFKAFTLGSVPSAVIDMPSVTSENYAKVFVFEDVSGISPYIKAMTVTSEGITQ